jgi:hypothetical protein
VLAWMRQDSVRVAMREAAWLRSLLREYFPAALVALSTEPENPYRGRGRPGRTRPGRGRPGTAAPVLPVDRGRPTCSRGRSRASGGERPRRLRTAACAELLGPHTQLRVVIQTAIWLRFDKSSLVRMCCTWFWAVRSER